MSERISPRTNCENQIGNFWKCPIPVFRWDFGVHWRLISKDFRLQISYHLNKTYKIARSLDSGGLRHPISYDDKPKKSWSCRDISATDHIQTGKYYITDKLLSLYMQSSALHYFLSRAEYKWGTKWGPFGSWIT